MEKDSRNQEEGRVSYRNQGEKSRGETAQIRNQAPTRTRRGGSATTERLLERADETEHPELKPIPRYEATRGSYAS